MKSLSILMALLVAGSLAAQGRVETGNGRVILFGEAIQTAGVMLGPGVKDQATWQTGAGLRLMGQFDIDSPWYWELAGRFSSTAYMVTNRDIASAPPANVLDATKIRVQYSYWSFGAGYLLPIGPALDFGIHLEGRGETINPKGEFSTTNGGTGAINAHTVYFRPWVRCSLDLKLKTGSMTTLIGGDLGVATLKAKQRAIMPLSEIDEQTLRSMAPSWSASFYAGVQF